MKVHTINLDRRTDRWERCQEIGKQTGLHFVRAQAPEMKGRAWLGCSWSHQLAVYDAKMRGDPYVLVAEDDVEVTRYFTGWVLERMIENADFLELGALYTGTVSFAQEIAKVWPTPLGSIIETDAYMSSQLVCYFARAYDAVLHWPVGWGSDYGKDPAVPSEFHDLMRCSPPIHIRRALTLPFLSIQRSDYSDNCGRVLDLDQNWKDAEQSWQNAVRNL